MRQKNLWAILKKKLPTDFFDFYVFQLREPQILKRSMWLQCVWSKMLDFLGGGVIIHYDITDSLWWRQIQSLRLDEDIDIVKSSSFDFALTNSVLYLWRIVHLSDQSKINVLESNQKTKQKQKCSECCEPCNKVKT